MNRKPGICSGDVCKGPAAEVMPGDTPKASGTALNCGMGEENSRPMHGNDVYHGGQGACGAPDNCECCGSGMDVAVLERLSAEEQMANTEESCIHTVRGGGAELCGHSGQASSEGRHTEDCLICGAPLLYRTEAAEMKCDICGSTELSQASCENGHFVCDSCHSRKAVERLMDWCVTLHSDDPVAILTDMMSDPDVYMHGPEHHILAGAALLTAYRNAGGDIDLPGALEEMIKRGSTVPGGACGFWGCCGAAVSAGIFMSIVTETTPLSSDTWGLCSRCTSRILASIGESGGPRCCKRTCYTALKETAAFVSGELGVKMHLPEKIRCGFYPRNAECLKEHCPYHPGYDG